MEPVPDRTVPDPVEVSTGVWSVALPFPNPLRYAFSHLVRVSDGIVAVDIGWESDECWDAFVKGMGRAGADVTDLVGVVVTHVHPDHYGLVERVRANTSAWIAVHPAEHPAIARAQQDRVDHVKRMASWLRECGAPRSQLEELQQDAADIIARISLVQPNYELRDADPVPATGGTIRAVHTPGHTPGHLCFHDRERNLLFTGDHILPRVTPNISRRPLSGVDPLGDFVRSVEKIRQFGDALVLPGHEWSFGDLTTRLNALTAHHTHRLDDIEHAVVEGAATVWEVARNVTWRRPFEQLDTRARRSALGETHSHLVRLAELGRVVHKVDEPHRWRPVAGRLSEPGP